MKQKIRVILTYMIAAIWLINGLFCKVFNFVPRHQAIVSKILGSDYAVLLTKTIGIAEIIMAIWVLSGIKSKFNAITQMIIIALMNILEFIFVPDLLLWGKFNAVFACLLIVVIYYNEFFLPKKYNNPCK